MADQPDANPHPQSARTRAILDDLAGGMPLAEVAARYGRPLRSISNTAYRYGIRRRGKS